MKKMFVTVASFFLILSLPALLHAGPGLNFFHNILAPLGPPPGSLDPSFNGNGEYTWPLIPESNVFNTAGFNAVAVDSQGGTIVAGCTLSPTLANGLPNAPPGPAAFPAGLSLYITRVTDKGIDKNFGGPNSSGVVTLNQPVCPATMTIDSHQNIVIGGFYYIGYNPADESCNAAGVCNSGNGPLSQSYFVGRLKNNGTWDPSFLPSIDNNGFPGGWGNYGSLLTLTFANHQGNDQGIALAIQKDGKIVMAISRHSGPSSDFVTTRLNPDGSMDNSFVGNSASFPPPPGEQAFTDGYTITHFGSSSNNSTSVPRAITIQPDGGILVVGSTTASIQANQPVNNQTHFAVVRYAPSSTPPYYSNGTPDSNFGSNGDGTIYEPLAPSSNEFATDIQISSPNSANQSFIYITGCSGNNLGTMQLGMKDGMNVAGGNHVTATNFGGTEYSQGSSCQCTGVKFGPQAIDPMEMMFGGEVLNKVSFDFVVGLSSVTSTTLFQKFGSNGIATAGFQNGNNSATAATMGPDGKIVVVGSNQLQTSNLAVARFNGM